MKQMSIKLLERLNAQAEEAEKIGLLRLADHVDECIVKSSEIKDLKPTYSSDEYEHDIESCVWDAIIATANYHGVTNIDAIQVQSFVEKFAEDLISSCKNQIKVKTAIGAYENKLPGEE